MASSSPEGFFKTGQNADILLSGFDFNNSGGPLVFNHPGSIASDGTRLFITDVVNKRMVVNVIAGNQVSGPQTLHQLRVRQRQPFGRLLCWTL
ncbi:MAG: hypothetical protein Q7K03_09010 [Dehalococcoidia bacterium]|nr:hypothetical protein [Dehalococcoidia bacterium]